jgi:branched-chain amino acid aminotransferase
MKKRKVIFINGKFLPFSKARISVFDHGLLYGDGVFEGIRAYNGKIFKLDEHIKRLYASAKAVMIEIPMSQEEMKENVIKTVRKNKLIDAYIRLVVTRGVGDLGLDPRKCPNPTIIIIADKIELYPPKFYQEGLEVITSSLRRIPEQCLSPQIKSLNYLNNILAKIEAINHGVVEAIMLNYEGYVSECTGDNIFIVKDSLIITPPAHLGILEGITRNTVIELASQLNYSVSEEIFTLYDVYNADECFLTGTGAEIIPVVKVDGRVIGNGKIGKVTQELINAFREYTMKEGTPVYE